MKFPNASESFKKLNPHFFAVGEFQPKIAQQKAEPALERKSSGHKARGARLDGRGPFVRVTFTAHRRRLLDGDNLQGGLKPLRDAIARSLCVDDFDGCIEWQYGQQITRGRVGTAVVIEYL